MITNSTNDTGMYFINYTDQTNSALIFRTLCSGIVKNSLTVDYQGNIGMGGYISNASTTSNSIGGVTLCNGYVVGNGSLLTNLPASTGAISNASNTSNSIGGVILCNRTLSAEELSIPSQYGLAQHLWYQSMYSNNTYNTNLLVSAERISATQASVEKLRINICTGAISNAATSSNRIGGVTLQSGALSISKSNIDGASFSIGYLSRDVTLTIRGVYSILLNCTDSGGTRFANGGLFDYFGSFGGTVVGGSTITIGSGTPLLSAYPQPGGNGTIQIIASPLACNASFQLNLLCRYSPDM
jgi:hypothetical protein